MNKQIKPEEIQTIPAFNYYTSKEELANARREDDKKLIEAIRENNREVKSDFRYLVGIMLGGFSIIITGIVTLIIELFLKH
jgi:hypothetical protein